MSTYLLESEFEYDFHVIGISCHAHDYRVSWSINQLLSINLDREDEVELKTKKAGVASFASFYYEDQETEKAYRLLANKYKKQLLIPEHKGADYLFVLYDLEQEEVNELLASLRNIKVILMCFEIKVDTLKSKQNLVF